MRRSIRKTVWSLAVTVLLFWLVGTLSVFASSVIALGVAGNLADGWPAGLVIGGAMAFGFAAALTSWLLPAIIAYCSLLHKKSGRLWFAALAYLLLALPLTLFPLSAVFCPSAVERSDGVPQIARFVFLCYCIASCAILLAGAIWKYASQRRTS